jgi:hypothetical protein
LPTVTPANADRGGAAFGADGFTGFDDQPGLVLVCILNDVILLH